MADFLTRMEIVLTNPQLVYYPGHLIQGQLLIDLKKDITIRNIRIVCRGRAHVRLKDGKRKTYSAHEDYMDEALVLHGNGPDMAESGDEEVVLPAGSHVFPFVFQLPAHLPASFEGLHHGCFVRYWLKGSIVTSALMMPQYKLVFTVGSSLDLNCLDETLAMIPLQGQNCKMTKGVFSKPQQVTANFRVDKTSYVPGEMILCAGEINNGSKKAVAGSTITLVMKTTYKTFTGKEECELRECARLRRGSISKGGSDVFTDVQLHVPPVPSSFLDGCRIIDINYEVQLNVDLGSSRELVVPLVITVGTVPHQTVVQNAISNSAVEANQAESNNLNLVSPSYRRYVFGMVNTKDSDDDDENMIGKTEYVPYYTYFDWLSPQYTYIDEYEGCEPRDNSVAEPNEAGMAEATVDTPL